MPNQMSSPNEVVVTTTSDYTFPTSGAIPSLLLVDTTAAFITGTGTGVIAIKYRIEDFA